MNPEKARTGTNNFELMKVNHMDGIVSVLWASVCLLIKRTSTPTCMQSTRSILKLAE